MNADVRILAAYEQVLAALAFYGDPDSYFAIAVFADRPAGGFADDFGDADEFPDYDRPMSGKRAREALRAWSDATHPERDPGEAKEPQ